MHNFEYDRAHSRRPNQAAGAQGHPNPNLLQQQQNLVRPITLIQSIVPIFNVDSRHDICQSWLYSRVHELYPKSPINLNKSFSVVKLLRKNRNIDSTCTLATGGVDLNRNYGYKWGLDNDGSNDNPCAEDYRGKAPFSEPETASMRDWFEGTVKGRFFLLD